MPARGPCKDLCVVVVTTSAKGKGDGCTPVATSPEMCDVHEQEGTHFVANLAELRPVDGPRVRRGTGDDHIRTEKKCALAEHVKIDKPRLLVHIVGQRLEINARRADRLRRDVVPVRQVATARQAQAHDAGVRLEERGVHSEVGRGAGVRLHVHVPLLVTQTERLQSALLTEQLDLVDHLVAAVVPLPSLALGVLVGKTGPHHLHHSTGGEVLRGDELDPARLAILLLSDQLRHLRVELGERVVRGRGAP